MKCSKISWKTGAATLVFKKHNGPTPADDIAPQIITECGNLTLDLKQLGLWASPPFLQTLGPWFPNEVQYMLSVWKEDFGPLGNSPVLLLLSPGKTPKATIACFHWCFFHEWSWIGMWWLKVAYESNVSWSLEFVELIITSGTYKVCDTMPWTMRPAMLLILSRCAPCLCNS